MSAKAKSVKKNKFALIVFEEKETCVVPVSWFDETKGECSWPDITGPSIASLLTNPNSLPKKSWKPLQARSLGTYKNLKSAREAESLSLLTSGIESDSENDELVIRRRRVKPRSSHSLTEEDREDEVDTIEGSAITGEINVPSTGLFEPVINSNFPVIIILPSNADQQLAGPSGLSNFGQVISSETCEDVNVDAEDGPFQLILTGCIPTSVHAETQTDDTDDTEGMINFKI
ncbi:unnamed protein product, partial [Allacma fusca]